MWACQSFIWMFTEKNTHQENRRSRAQIEINANLMTYFLHFIAFLKTEQVWQALSKQTNKLHKKSATYVCFDSVIMGFFAALSIHYWVGVSTLTMGGFMLLPPQGKHNGLGIAFSLFPHTDRLNEFEWMTNNLRSALLTYIL